MAKPSYNGAVRDCLGFTPELVHTSQVAEPSFDTSPASGRPPRHRQANAPRASTVIELRDILNPSSPVPREESRSPSPKLPNHPIPVPDVPMSGIHSATLPDYAGNFTETAAGDDSLAGHYYRGVTEDSPTFPTEFRLSSHSELQPMPQNVVSRHSIT
ncbi:hypothetical protein BD311DRAFT_658827 [Dichomitus squalens]|uniref:Uncharacterized protein n=1 Tax=Dichomitus squalens TaxID=114155 RepID=A0A4Q9MRJ6_9APHY|nr:hypothetical protein BD311DRAFT_658827 [Dichomitus squalens]